MQHECSVRKLVDRRAVAALSTRVRVDTLGVELLVDRVGADLAGVELAPDRNEPKVVLTPTERTRSMARSERGRLVEKEQLGEATRLE